MLEDLKKEFPGMSDEVLQSVIDEQGIDTSPDTTEQEEEEDNSPDEVEESTEEETESEEQEQSEPAEQEEKKVSLKALHEERNKRKALSAQLEAMKSEIEAIKNRPTQQVQQQEQKQDVSEWVEQQAEKEVRKNLSFDGDLDLLQYEDPAKYRKINKEIAKAEIRIESELNNRAQIQQEVNLALQDINSRPDYKEVNIYAEQTLGDLPFKEAQKIQNAVDSLNRGTPTKEQVSMLKTFYERCETEYRQSINPSKSTKVAQPANKIADMANHPRASQLSGSNGSRSLSTAELESMLDQGRFNELPPEVIKKYMR